MNPINQDCRIADESIESKTRTISEKEAYWLSFGLLVALCAAFFAMRGFKCGWDGDTIVSAAQFNKILYPNLRSVPDGGTAVKLFMLTMMGIASKIKYGFFLTTILCVLLNAWSFGLLCSWVTRSRGILFFLWIGAALNANWLDMILQVDNPAMGLPLAIGGLYYFCAKKRRYLGTLLLLFSNFFRPGSEIILLGLFTIEFLGPPRNWRLLLTMACAGLLSTAHTLYGCLLAYSSLQDNVRQVIHFPPDAVGQMIDQYQHKVLAFSPYLETIYNIFLKDWGFYVFPFFVLGVIRAFWKKSSASYFLLMSTASIFPPLVTYFYGMNYGAINYHMQFYFVLTFFSSFAFGPSIESAPFRQYLTAALGIITLSTAFALSPTARWGIYQTSTGANPYTGNRWANVEPALPSIREMSQVRHLRMLAGADQIPILITFAPYLESITNAGKAYPAPGMPDRYLKDPKGTLTYVAREQDLVDSDREAILKTLPTIDVAWVHESQPVLISALKDNGFFPRLTLNENTLFARY